MSERVDTVGFPSPSMLESRIPVATLGPAAPPVGVLRWRGPSRVLGVIVKATFSYASEAPDGSGRVRARLASVQDALSLGAPSGVAGADPRERAYVSDFVPWKSGCDVLLCGHARTVPRPSSGAALGSSSTTRIEASVNIEPGALRRSFAAVSKGATDRIPLAAGHLESLDGIGGVIVGPAIWHALPPEGLRHPPDFDYGVYNAAHTAQRLPALAPGTVIDLLGLSARTDRLRVELPAVEPVVLAGWDRAYEQGCEVAMTCDTLFIDTDREAIILVWRGRIDVDAMSSTIDRLAVSFEPAATPRTPLAIQRELPRAAFTYAKEQQDAAPGSAPPELGADDLALLRLETWGNEEAPEPALSLARYAAISAELQEQREPREDTLRRHGLDDYAWTLEERAVVERMGSEALEGDGRVAVELGEAFVAAQDGLAGPRDAAFTLQHYAEILVALERGDPGKVLQERGVSQPEWMRLERRWVAAAGGDPRVAAELDRLVAEQEALAPEEEPGPDDDVDVDAEEG